MEKKLLYKRILLVEDDEDKKMDIADYFLSEFNLSVDFSRSFQSGKKAIIQSTYDLVLMDMTIPTFDVSPTETGGRSQPFGGRNLLLEMQRRRINCPVIVITQFDYFGADNSEISLKELKFDLKNEFSAFYIDTIAYNIGNEDWKAHLNKLIISNV